MSVLTRRLVRAISLVSTPVSQSKRSLRVRSAMTTSSREVLPARSPMPLMAHSTWVAPARTAASELAVARPRSLWQWTLTQTSSSGGQSRHSSRMKSPNSTGTAYPTVSGTLMVVAPHSTATPRTLARNSGSERLASMALNSTSAPAWVLARSRARLTMVRVSASTSSGVFLIWYFICTGLVLMNVWMRGFSATLTASQHTRMSFSMARARPAMRGPLTSPAICLTASKSSGEAIGNPASMVSTPSRAS